jgi:hypothetical protein
MKVETKAETLALDKAWSQTYAWVTKRVNSNGHTSDEFRTLTVHSLIRCILTSLENAGHGNNHTLQTT